MKILPLARYSLVDSQGTEHLQRSAVAKPDVSTVRPDWSAISNTRACLCVRPSGLQVLRPRGDQYGFRAGGFQARKLYAFLISDEVVSIADVKIVTRHREFSA